MGLRMGMEMGAGDIREEPKKKIYSISVWISAQVRSYFRFLQVKKSPDISFCYHVPICFKKKFMLIIIAAMSMMKEAWQQNLNN
jgi:hypothetical protein